MFEVCGKQCDQCLFSNNKIVSDSRKKSLLEKITKEQGFFECHKATIAGKHTCCKGFYDQLSYHSQMIRIAERIGAVRFVEVPKALNSTAYAQRSGGRRMNYYSLKYHITYLLPWLIKWQCRRLFGLRPIRV